LQVTLHQTCQKAMQQHTTSLISLLLLLLLRAICQKIGCSLHARVRVSDTFLLSQGGAGVQHSRSSHSAVLMLRTACSSYT
jgi:hypothetical protein